MYVEKDIHKYSVTANLPAVMLIRESRLRAVRA